MKKVRAKTHDTIIYKDALVSWSDVWICFTAKPARKTVRLGPTLIGRKSLEGDLYIAKKCFEDCKTKKPDLAEDFQSEIDEHTNTLKELDSALVVVKRHKDNPDCPDVYINKEWFNRRDAELMIDVLMRDLGYTGAKVKWHRPPKIVIQTVP